MRVSFPNACSGERNCTWAAFQPGTTFLEFDSMFRLLCNGALVATPSVIVMDTTLLPTSLLSLRNIRSLMATYAEKFDDLQKNVDTTVVVVSSSMVRTALQTVLKMKAKHATNVVVVRNATEALAACQHACARLGSQ